MCRWRACEYGRDRFTVVSVKCLSSSSIIPGRFASGLIRTGTWTLSPATSGNVGCRQTPAQVLSFSHTRWQREEEHTHTHTHPHKRVEPGPVSPLMFSVTHTQIYRAAANHMQDPWKSWKRTTTHCMGQDTLCLPWLCVFLADGSRLFKRHSRWKKSQDPLRKGKKWCAKQVRRVKKNKNKNGVKKIQFVFLNNKWSICSYVKHRASLSKPLQDNSLH